MTKNHKIILALVLAVLILVLIIWQLTPKINHVEIPKDDESLGISEHYGEAEVETSEAVDVFKNQREKTLNILLIGVDQPSGYASGQRSDIMMLMSLKKDDPMVRLTSFMRDTMAKIPSTDTLEKLNNSYWYDGSLGVMRALNVNYDLNVRDYVRFDYEAIAALVDAVGGVEVYVEPAVLEDINFMAIQGAGSTTEPLDGPGWHTLDGKQSILFSRTRYYTGGDTARTARQREVFIAVVKKLRAASPQKLYKIAKDILPLVETSYDYSDITELLDYFVSIRRGVAFKQATFPYTHGGWRYEELWYEVSEDLEQDIKDLHQELFDEEDYELSERAQEIVQEIKDIPFY